MNLSTLEIETSWNDEKKKILFQIRGELEIRRELHLTSQKFYTKIDRFFSIPIYLLSGTAGGSLITDKPDRIDDHVLGYIVLLVGITNFLQRYFKFSNKADKHKISLHEYDKILKDINLMVASEIEKINANMFIINIQQQYDRLIETSPNVLKRIKNKVIKKISRKKNIFINIDELPKLSYDIVLNNI